MKACGFKANKQPPSAANPNTAPELTTIVSAKYPPSCNVVQTKVTISPAINTHSATRYPRELVSVEADAVIGMAAVQQHSAINGYKKNTRPLGRAFACINWSRAAEPRSPRIT